LPFASRATAETNWPGRKGKDSRDSTEKRK